MSVADRDDASVTLPRSFTLWAMLSSLPANSQPTSFRFPNDFFCQITAAGSARSAALFVSSPSFPVS